MVNNLEASCVTGISDVAAHFFICLASHMCSITAAEQICLLSDTLDFVKYLNKMHYATHKDMHGVSVIRPN